VRVRRKDEKKEGKGKKEETGGSVTKAGTRRWNGWIREYESEEQGSEGGGKGRGVNEQRTGEERREAHSAQQYHTHKT